MSLSCDKLEMEIAESMPESEQVKFRAVPLGEITRDVMRDPSELLRHRFLCRGGAAMLIGPTGIGKSSFIMQAAILWSLGKSFFGVEPARPLTSLIVQAENDDGDLAEMRDGIFAGLNLSDEEKQLANDRVFIYCENSKTGEGLVSEVLRPLLREHQPDLLWLDHLFAYSGCNVSDQERISLFLRGLLNPLISDFQCGLFIGHHTNKPHSGDEKPERSVNDSAYLGAGSAELANWPRAVLSIRALKVQGVFELVVGKRGGRLRWTDASDQPTCRKTIAHSQDGIIYWREASSNEGAATTKKKPTKYDVQQLLVPRQELTKEALISKANNLMGINKAKGFIAELVGDGVLRVIEKPRPRTNPEIFLERVL
jgi:hypothetical protein